MTELRAFTWKEFLWTARTGKLMFSLILFVLFGIMNPAIAKLTPWLMETVAESLADSGLNIVETTVNALTSWNQFCKNIPMAMVWTAGYWLCFAVTWGYNRFFWNDGSAAHVVAAGGCYYLLGLWLITLILLTSAVFKTSGAALSAVVCSFATVYLLGMIPAVKEYLPGFLLGGQALLASAAEPADFVPVVLITLGMSIANLVGAAVLFARRMV